ncbi:DegT/DnrJ/EryC1/StrS family aminotransferase [Lysobacter sp. CCNWLW3]|uniref:DegT/DnrJ/EryC1/StrS family aminotransferase n=1 Tax=unclassified Lysobacter TaxID=2635362 RepID=UPI002FD57BCC
MPDTPIIPVNSLSRHTRPLEAALIASTSEVIRSGYYVLGPNVNRFESAFAAYCGAGHCIGVANGTDALELALKAVGVVPGDQVAVTANAAMYGTTAVLACGAHPLFVDVEAASSTMCPQQLAAVLAEHAPKAVIVTHLYGRLAAIEALVSLCREHGIAVVEDCAQAHGARRNGRTAGSFGDIAAFSFYPTKNLGALGDGGAVVTSDPALAQRTRQLRQYGWSAKYSNELGGGRNSRLDEIQARMLDLMLPLLDGWNDRRREIANRYSEAIGHPDIAVPATAGEEYVGHLYVVHSPRRDALREHLHAQHIQTEVHYPVPDHRQPCHAGSFDGVRLPVAELQAATALTLPCFPELDDTEVQRVIDACNQF